MLETLDRGLLRELWDRAMLLLGFAGGLRRSEIVALDCGRDQTEDGHGWIEILGEGVLVTLRGKTGWREVEIGRGSSDSTCPAVALETWLKFARISHGPLFRRVIGHGKKVVSDRLNDQEVVAFPPRRCAVSGPCWRIISLAFSTPPSLPALLAIDGKTIASYLDLLVDLLLVRKLEPWHANVGKRLVKSPRVYVRDSGIVHTLLGLTTLEDIHAHPVAGASWEGFVIETVIAVAPSRTEANFYRTSAGAEIDLLMTPSRRPALGDRNQAQPDAKSGEGLSSGVRGRRSFPSLRRLSRSRGLSAEARYRSGAAAHTCENAGRTGMITYRSKLEGQVLTGTTPQRAQRRLDRLHNSLTKASGLWD